MALTFTTGNTYSSGDTVTAANLNAVVNAATYAGFLEVAKGGSGAITAVLGRANLNKGETALVDAATVATDCSLGNVFTVTLAGNRTLGAPTNLAAGATYIWRVKQDATGNRTLAYNAVFKWPSGSIPVLSTPANALDIISGVSDGTNIFCTFVPNLS